MHRRASLLLAALLAASVACDPRERPLPPEVAEEVRLEVRIIAPATDQLLIAGDTALILIQAREPAARLHGVGFVARRPGGLGPPLDSVVARFGPVADTTVEFRFELPTTLPPSAQVDIFGLAFGPEPRDTISAPNHVIVVPCPTGANWC